MGRLTEGEKNGKNYRKRISESRQQDAAIRVYNQVYGKIQEVYETLSEKQGWKNPLKCRDKRVSRLPIL